MERRDFTIRVKELATMRRRGSRGMTELIFAEDEKKKRRGLQNDVAGNDE